MTNDTSVKAFKCPSCGAPLQPETGTLTMKCPYCSGTVIIPESMRTPPPSSSGPSIGEVFQFGMNGVDLNQIMGNAMHLPQAIALAQQGKIDEAADLYAKITGLEHADAVNAVKDMASGRAVSLTPGIQGTSWKEYKASFSSPSAEVNPPSVMSVMTSSTNPASSISNTSTSKKSGGRSCGVLIAILSAVAALIIVLVAGAFFFFSNGKSSGSLIPIGFASQSLSFGSEGIGSGMLEDARSVGVDGNGNITVADYQDGRVQIFDPKGKFISGFSASTGKSKVYITGMAVSRDGTIYIDHDQKIFIFNPGGNQIGQIGDDKHSYSDVTFGQEGKLYAVANDDTIVRFKSDDTIDLEIPNTFSNVTGNSELDAHLAVDGLGNMFLVGSFNYVVLKFSPQGKFVNQFGGEAKSAANSEPGKFSTPRAIAVDGYDRVYVSDFQDIKVFDSDGTYLNTIGIDAGGPFGLAFDTNNNLYTVTTQTNIVKFEIQKPQSN